MNRRQRPTPSVKEESFGEFLEPSTSRIPETSSASGHEDEMETDSEQFCYVEVALEDEDSDALNRMNETSINSTLNGIPEGAQGGPAEQITHEEASDDRPAKRRRNKRSLIWRHYEQLDCLGAARCRICLKKLQYFEGGSTSNLHRHMSKRHPEMFSQLIADGQPPPPPPRASQSSNANGHKATAPESVTTTERQRPFSVQSLLYKQRINWFRDESNRYSWTMSPPVRSPTLSGATLADVLSSCRQPSLLVWSGSLSPTS